MNNIHNIESKTISHLFCMKQILRNGKPKAISKRISSVTITYDIRKQKMVLKGRISIVIVLGFSTVNQKIFEKLSQRSNKIDVVCSSFVVNIPWTSIIYLLAFFIFKLTIFLLLIFRMQQEVQKNFKLCSVKPILDIKGGKKGTWSQTLQKSLIISKSLAVSIFSKQYKITRCTLQNHFVGGYSHTDLIFDFYNSRTY